MEKLAENDLTYFYLRHVVIVVTAVTTISLTLVKEVWVFLCILQSVVHIFVLWEFTIVWYNG
jgi:hypothetical protein